MISRPEGHLFRHHAEFFDCPSREEYAALQHRSGPPSSAGEPFLAHCESVMTDLSPDQSLAVARMLMRACWAARQPVPDWLDRLSKSTL